MGSCVLKGITTALLVTVLTLLAGMIWSAVGLGGLSIANSLDIGLLASCLVGGYRTAKESGVWMLGGVTGAGYVSVGTLLLALFLPIRGLGFVQVLGEGIIIGSVAGAVGAGGQHGAPFAVGQGKRRNPSYRDYTFKEDEPAQQFEWDSDEEAAGAEKEARADWLDSEADEYQESHGAQENQVNKPAAKQDSQEDVEWSWDKEAKEERTTPWWEE